MLGFRGHVHTCEGTNNIHYFCKKLYQNFVLTQLSHESADIYRVSYSFLIFIFELFLVLFYEINEINETTDLE